MKNTLPTDYQTFIALSRYARWKEDEQRRETWTETVVRYVDYISNHVKKKHDYELGEGLKYELEEALIGAEYRSVFVFADGFNCAKIPCCAILFY